jgi:hypothetical protein
MYCFRENSNFPFSNQKIITFRRPSIGGDKLSELTSKKKNPKSINKQQQKRKNIV